MLIIFYRSRRRFISGRLSRFRPPTWEGKDLQFRIRSLIGIALQLDSSERLTVPFEITPPLCWLQGRSVSVETTIIFLTDQKSQSEVYTQCKGDRQALGLVVHQLAKILLQAARNQMWLIESEDTPTMTPGKGDNQNGEVAPGLLSGRYRFRITERSFSPSFTRNGDN